jgi:replication factor A1
MSYEKREPIEATVAELKPQMRNITISFKVIEIGEEREITSRRDDTAHTVVDVIIGDSTGIVRLPLWDNAIELVENDKTYLLTNGYTGLFRGNLQLNVGRYGNLAEADDVIDEVNMDIDMSVAEHEDTRQRRSYDKPRDGDGHRRERRDYGSSKRRVY